MLYTCGLLNVGPACFDQGKPFGTHGEIAHTPATRTSVTTDWEQDQYMLKLAGEMREASLFGENLVLHRTISTTLGSKSIRIADTLENQGFEAQDFMLLYHFNIGYPVLDEALRVKIPSVRTRQRDREASDIPKSFESFSEPIDGKEEEVFYHQTLADESGFSWAALFNDNLDLGIIIKYDSRTLPNLIQWKSMKSGDYALGIEPANCLPEGRLREKERGTIHRIQPFKVIPFEIELTILEGKDEYARVVAAIDRLHAEK